MSKNNIIWKTHNDEVISCDEKLKVLEQNLEEILIVYQNSLEDAVLFGVSPENFRENIVKVLINSFDNIL